MDSVILKSFLPEIFLSVAILFNLIFNSLLLNTPKFNYPIMDKELISQLSLVLAICLLLLQNNCIEGHFVYFLFINNFSVKLAKILILLASIFCIFPVNVGFKSQKLNFFEYYIIFLFSVFATLLLVSAADLLSVYLSVEMQSLSFFVLASFKRNSVFSSEAGLKYFIMGSFISGVLLFGCSILFGSLGTLSFPNLKILLSFPLIGEEALYNNMVLIGALCLIVVFLFKVAAAPFHFWMPDVYEGSPLSSTIIFSIIPKLAIFYLFLKWLSIIEGLNDIKEILIISGLLSTLIGSFFALRQKRLKRLVVYSSIGQIGFLILGASVINSDSFGNVYFFLIVYLLTSFLLWFLISLSFNFSAEVAYFDDVKKVNPLFLSNLSSLFNVNQSWALSNLLIFFSFAGIPPLLGFFAKFLIFFSLIRADYYWSSFWLLLLSIISVFYYLRVLKIIFFEKLSVTKLNSSQIVFNSSSIDFDCLILSFFLLLLLFLFFYPSCLLLITSLITFNFF